MARQKRNKSLLENDVYMLPDFPITPDKLEKLNLYRQESRDCFQKEEGMNFNLQTNINDVESI
jgi:hypothetical protein